MKTKGKVATAGITVAVEALTSSERMSDVGQLNLSALPIREDDYLAGCPRYDRCRRLRKLADAVRWGKMKRIIIGGMPVYYPVPEAQR